MYNNYIYEASEGGLSWQCQLKLIGKQSSLFEAVLNRNDTPGISALRQQERDYSIL